MKACLIIFFVLVTLTSCEKDPATKIGPLDGTYQGVFYRSSPQGNYMTADVTLVFDGNTFEGSSSITKYPAICRGTYTLTGDKIEFANVCFWTAEFDWTYILDGKFEVTTQGGEVTMTRHYGEHIQDTYKLTR